MLKVQPSIKRYAWGTTDASAAIRALVSKEDAMDPAPLAELWYGTHHSGPARVEITPGVLLGLETYLEVPLPYLLKVISVKQALSIQLHPSKEAAVRLHRSDPANYPDDEPKPEMLVALGDFEALVGFRSIAEIRGGPLAPFLGTSTITVRDAVRACLDMPDELFEEAVGVLSPEYPLVCRLQAQYPGDRGVLIGAFLMTYVSLKKGQCLVISDHEVHAYLSGEGIELMNRSDNVIRLGLTPKFKDRNAFFDLARLDDCGVPPTVVEPIRGGVYKHPEIPSCQVRVQEVKEEITASRGFLLIIGQDSQSYWVQSPTTIYAAGKVAVEAIDVN